MRTYEYLFLLRPVLVNQHRIRLCTKDGCLVVRCVTVVRKGEWGKGTCGAKRVITVRSALPLVNERWR